MGKKKVKAVEKVEEKAEEKASVLPSKASEVSIEMKDFRWWFHGPPKVGKTSLAAQFSKPMFIQSEVGTKALSVHGKRCSNWKDITDVAVALQEEKHDFQTVVFDTIERCYFFLTEQVAVENGVTHISQIKWARGYDECNKRLLRVLEDLYDFGLCVVLISHTRHVTTSRGAVEIVRSMADLSDSPRKVIYGYVDIQLFLDVEEEIEHEEGGVSFPRVAICQPLPDVEAGGRLCFLPVKIPLGESAKEGYGNLEAEFRRAVRRMLDEMGESAA